MIAQRTRLTLQIESRPAVGDEEREELTRQLERDLLELDAEVTRPVRTAEAPAGAKGIIPLDLGTLLVTMAASGGVLTTLINAVQSWVTRHEQHGVSLEIGGDKLSINCISSRDQQRLIDDWLSRHSKLASANE